MLTRTSLLGFAASTLLWAQPAFAQLLVDAGGPRDIFYDSGRFEEGLKGLHFKVDTSRKGVDLTYLGYPIGTNLVLGSSVKATAVDGLEQFFRFDRWPKVELALLASKYWHKTIDDEHAWLFSLTTRAAGSYADYAFFDASLPAEPYFQRGFIAGEITETLSMALPNGTDCFALSAGYRVWLCIIYPFQSFRGI